MMKLTNPYKIASAHEKGCLVSLREKEIKEIIYFIKIETIYLYVSCK